MAKKQYGTRKRYHFIYKTTNNLSGRYYIGMHSTDNLEDGYLGSGICLRNSLNKHGKENHSIEILEFLDSREELVAREIEIISLQEIAKKDCMNLKVGGVGGFTEEMWENARIASKVRMKKNWEDPEYRLLQLKFSFQKGHKIWEGKSHAPETIQKMKEIRKGRGKGGDNSQHGTCWIMMDGINKKVKNEELASFIAQGWSKGRKLK